ncbi:F-box protein SKIP16-like isoform X2 [Olea europaea var. sylvestris]|uniref:F-box protein SKIP16-like isoform X2 n=1 Tax=Olea europaea var. sylvestris TaxID=158386 RepID=UPI000C1CD1D2|nr:F-box protein SKIP16-like isoform X2 [Olea europaea var. sylvestris]
MELESVGGLAMHTILSKLGPSDAASVSCVGKRFLVWASDDSLWAKFCFFDLELSSPLDPHGNPAPSFKAAYKAWRQAFSTYPWPLVIRAKQCWSRLKSWLAVNFPEVLPTLREGASEAEITEFENSMKVKLPLPTRLLYRFCDGQELPNEEFSGSFPSTLLGIMGGYSLYDHLVNVFLLPLSQVILDTKGIMHHMGFSNRSEYIVVAASATYSEKIFFLNCRTGQLFVGTRNLAVDGEMLPCVPDTLISSVHESKGSEQQDAMLLWLEEHGRRLHDGTIKVRQERKIRSINLFPEQPPLCSSAITNGVKVHASAVFVPEFSNLRDESEKFLFAYSIRMSLSPGGCVIEGMMFSSCQLYRRHWTIRANDAVVSNVNGEAVIGRFPLLHPGEDEFVYESCTPLPSSLGSIEGSFTFVPGRLADPKGGHFKVEVARFPLQLPDFIY